MMCARPFRAYVQIYRQIFGIRSSVSSILRENRFWHLPSAPARWMKANSPGLLTIPFPGVFRACRAWGRLPVLVASIVRYRLSWIRSNWRPQVSQQRRFHASYVMFKWRRLAVMPSLDMESNRFVFLPASKTLMTYQHLNYRCPAGSTFAWTMSPQSKTRLQNAARWLRLMVRRWLDSKSHALKAPVK